MKACKNCLEPIVARTGESPAQVTRRVFCNRQCMKEWMLGQIKIPNVTNSRRQSGAMAEKACDGCGATNVRLNVHHVDENPLNNSPLNLRTLCASCHGRSHSPNFTTTGEQRRPCMHCSKPAQKRGLCWGHHVRLKRYGDPLVTKRKRGSSWVLVASPLGPSRRSGSASKGGSVNFADTATRSTSKRPPSSSAPASKPSRKRKARK